jgi:cell division protein FtsL
MEKVKHLTQAYQQTPWRRQLQAIVTFLLALVLAALVAGIYLSVSARAVAEGHEIQWLRSEIEQVQRKNADLETQLAFLSSMEVMEERARQLGYRPAGGDEILYLAIPGYTAPKEAILAPPPGLVAVEETRVISPAYTESLIDWFKKQAVLTIAKVESEP